MCPKHGTGAAGIVRIKRGAREIQSGFSPRKRTTAGRWKRSSCKRIGFGGPLHERRGAASPAASLNYGSAGDRVRTLSDGMQLEKRTFLHVADGVVREIIREISTTEVLYSEDLKITPETVVGDSFFHSAWACTPCKLLIVRPGETLRSHAP